jgi:WD40 repeat protein
MRGKLARAALVFAVAALLVGGGVGYALVREAREPIVFRVPGGILYHVALSPDGDQVVAWESKRGQLLLWRVARGATSTALSASSFYPHSSVNGLGFSPDGTRVLALERLDRWYSWSADETGFASGPSAIKIPFEELARPARLSPRGDLAATNLSDGVELWDLARGAFVRTVGRSHRGDAVPSGDQSLPRPGFSPSGELVWRWKAHELHAWSVRDGREVVSATMSESPAALLDPGDAYLAWSVHGLLVLEIGSDHCRQALTFADSSRVLTVSRDGELVALGGSGRVEVRNLKTGALLTSFQAPPTQEETNSCHGLSFDAAGDRLAAVWDESVTVARVRR